MNWWGWGTWGTVSTWVPWGWSQPRYYNFGDNIYFQGDMVYYNSQPLVTTQEFIAQAEDIAFSIPEEQPDEDSWMPLGVFALTSETDFADDEPTMFLQLALSKEGIIGGTFQNVATDTVEPIEGMVDKESQRAAWTIVGETRPLMEAGVANLTQDTTPVLIHFEDDTTQQWLLVRLEEPEDG